MNGQMNPRFISPNAVLVEVIITASGGFTPSVSPFVDQQQLIGRPIVAIESFCDLDIKFSPYNANIKVIPKDAFKSMFVNIHRSGKLAPGQKDGVFYKYIPLARLRTNYVNDSNQTPLPSSAMDIFQVKPMFFQWVDSNVAAPTPVSMGADAAWSVPFLIHYLMPEEDRTMYE